MGAGMDRAGEMAAFVEAVERASFSAAARALKLTPSALSKLVARLEARLGVSLMRRTTRKLSLTPEGEAYFHRARRILEDIKGAEAEVAGFRERPRGLLKINTGNAFGIHQLVPALPDFLQRYPDLKVELSLVDQRVDLVAAGSDLAVRTGGVFDDQLVARKVCDLRRMICATPGYLARHGIPRRPEDLARHACVTMAGMPHLSRWPFRSGTVTVSGPATSDSATAVLELGLRGLGLIRLGDFVLARYVREGALVPVLVEHHKVEPVPIHVVYPQSRHRVPKTAAFVEFMLRRFAHAPWRID
jgi:DNA-binding transcriptional LysR family regulator